MEALSEKGIPVGVMIGPVIPGLTDHEIPEIIKQSVKAGAQFARYILLRLPHGVKDLFENWLEKNFPAKKEKILNRIRSTRNGNLYDSTYFERHKGNGIFAEQIQAIFDKSCKKAGIDENRLNLTIKHYKKLSGDQLSLF
jgi:DNA repair photolyase